MRVHKKLKSGDVILNVLDKEGGHMNEKPELSRFRGYVGQRANARYLAFILMSCLGLIGCGLIDREPTATNETVFITVEVTSAPSAANTNTPTTVVENQSSATPVPEESSRPAGPPTPAESATCGPPSGWVRYTVKGGDNLFRLAVNTKTTVPEVKEANCLPANDDTIYRGQVLYLPTHPSGSDQSETAVSVTNDESSPDDTPTSTHTPTTTTTPTATTTTTSTPTPTPTPTETTCDSDFCPNPDLEGTLVLDPGGPNNASFVPCEFVTEPRIEFDTGVEIVELGQRRYFYVCMNDPVTAVVTGEDGSSKSVPLLSTLPNPDLKSGNAQAFIDWPALPMEPTTVHTMTVTSGDGTAIDFLFLVQNPTKERILAVPPAGPPGTVFQVYYVNFELGSTATIDFYGEDEPSVGAVHEMSQRSSWTVSIDKPLANNGGWTQKPLVSEETDLPGAYSITFDGQRIFNLFWLQ